MVTKADDIGDNEWWTAIRITQFVFGVLLGFPLALVSLFMLPNIELVFSETPTQITNEQYLRHYLFWGAATIGYIAIVIAFFRRKAMRRTLRCAVLAGLGIGLLVTLWVLFVALQPIYGYLFLGYSGAAATIGLYFAAFIIGLLVAGMTLALQVAKR
jgi:hypothetical protein